jgi:hypothetical protein
VSIQLKWSVAAYNVKIAEESTPEEILLQADHQFNYPHEGSRFKLSEKRYKVTSVLFSAQSGMNDTIQEVLILIEETSEKGNYPTSIFSSP